MKIRMCVGEIIATTIMEGVNKNRKVYGGLVCNFVLERFL
jgi:hypothetical protein